MNSAPVASRAHFARKSLFYIGFALALAACTRAPGVRPRNEAPAAVAPATPGLFLYEARGPHGAAQLLGTIHLGFGFEEVLTPDARRRFEAATRVITEADIAAANPERLIQAALLPPERSLRALVGESVWQQITRRLGPQVPAPLLDRLEPWLPAIMLGLDDLERALAQLRPGAETRLMDVELMKRASALGKELAHFETVEEQLALFDSISVEEQVRELTHSLDEESRELARLLIEAFAAGDERLLVRALFDREELESAPGFYQRVLFERNARWLPAIEREIEHGGAFIAVGAAHLLGERGILHELAQHGYHVERVGAASAAAPVSQ